MNAPRSSRSALLPIFLVVLVDVFGLTLVIPLLAIYAEHFHASPLQATLLVSVYAGFQLVSGPVLGSLSDRYGRKPLLLLSQLGTLVGFVLMARASTLWMLFLARALDGATAGNLSLAQAYVSDHTKPEDRTKSFALIGIAFGVGFFFGPFVSGALSQRGLTAPIWLAAGLSATSIAATALLIPGGPPPAERLAEAGPAGKRLSVLEWGAYRAYFTRPVLAGLLLEIAAFMFSAAVFQSGFALFAERRFTWEGHAFRPREIGYLFAFAGFLGIVLQGGLLGRLARRYGDPALVRAGFLALVAGYAVLASAHTLAPLLVATALSAFGTSVLRPALTSMLSRRADAREQGTVLGLTQSFNSLASLLAAPLGGLLLDRGWLAAWALLPACFALAGLAAGARGSALVARERAAELASTPGGA